MPFCTVLASMMRGGVFADMMNQSNRDAGFSLQRAQVSEQRGDLAGYVFIDGMDSHQRIEHEQHGLMSDDGGLEPVLVLEAIQPHRTGRVRVGQEEWRAEGEGSSRIPEGAEVEVLRVDGTHLVVRPRNAPPPGGPEGGA